MEKGGEVWLFLKNVRGLASTEVPVEKLGPTHRVVLQFLVVHVNDVGTDAIQEVLGMGDEDQDALKTAKPKTQSRRCSKPETVPNR